MQIDFHHTVLYVVARLANYSIEDAKIISYSSQYVDEAVNSGIIKFRNKARYSRISSAHKMLDYRNFEELSNHLVWIPFHFLPGNAGKKAEENTEDGFVHKLVCTPDSYIAQDMIKSCIENQKEKYALHRLGICLHVLADTFAHQNFAGINHKINDVENMKKNDEMESTLLGKLSDYFGDLFDNVTNKVVSSAFPLGHGGALTCPDLPFLKWQYKNGKGKLIKRDNTKIFLDAVERIYDALVCFKKEDPHYVMKNDEKIPQKDLDKIRDNFLKFEYEEGNKRHKKWLKSIKNGDFSFGKEELKFKHKDIGSWKYEALHTRKEIENKKELFKYKSDFLDSNWKLFHDALQFHRLDIIKNILPKYGICVA